MTWRPENPAGAWHEPAMPGDLAFRTDGTQIAVVYHSGSASACQVIDVETGRLVRSIPLKGAARSRGALDDATLATPCEDSKVYLWDAVTGV